MRLSHTSPLQETMTNCRHTSPALVWLWVGSAHYVGSPKLTVITCGIELNLSMYLMKFLRTTRRLSVVWLNSHRRPTANPAQTITFPNSLSKQVPNLRSRNPPLSFFNPLLPPAQNPSFQDFFFLVSKVSLA
ncbi:hypothetical protein CDAR_232981 [Caerostris darwini]|uniref:Uncharacterized protein n=1 Tax=Caerostris darwini TaxID=1538125 RepID=A0AAV4Q482_9ARAC|nr:hypothetical protein CDAR_232981 [Caerostris darwini]